MRLRRGATWAEGLAVICIMVVLTAIFMPSLCACSKESSKTTRCLINVKQMATGHLIYANDHGDRLPPAQAWMDAAASYTKSGSVFQCPLVVKEYPRGHGYAFRQELSRRRLETVKRPESVVMLYDSACLTRNASDRLESLPQPGRHTGRRNVFAYVDGHTKVR